MAYGFLGPGQGQGAGYVNCVPVKFQDPQPTEWLNAHEASARRGQARMSDGSRRGSGGGNPGSQDSGGSV
jgi:hypothetical protein